MKHTCEHPTTMKEVVEASIGCYQLVVQRKESSRKHELINQSVSKYINCSWVGWLVGWTRIDKHNTCGIDDSFYGTGRKGDDILLALWMAAIR
jgi:hypothetical protein